MLHKTGDILAQVLAYPQKSRCARFVPAGVTAPTGFGAGGLHPRKCDLVVQRKKGCPTQGPALLLRLCFIKTLKKKTEEQPEGAAQAHAVRRAGAGDGKDKPRRWQPGVGALGFRAFKGRQAVHNALDDINGWGGAAMAQSAGPWRGRSWEWRAGPQKTKAVGAAGKPAQGADQHAQPCRACVRKASRSPQAAVC